MYDARRMSMNNANPSSAPAPALTAVPSTTTGIALIATFAALIAALSLAPAVALGGIAVPITLQTLGVALAGGILGPRRGALATALYLVVGLAGVPVFAQFHGGISVLAQPSAGYLLSFPLAAFLIGYIAIRVPRQGKVIPVISMFGAMVAGAVIVYPAGITMMAWRAGLTWGEAFMANLTFVPGDLIKAIAATVIVLSVRKAFPQLIRS